MRCLTFKNFPKNYVMIITGSEKFDFEGPTFPRKMRVWKKVSVLFERKNIGSTFEKASDTFRKKNANFEKVPVLFSNTAFFVE